LNFCPNFLRILLIMCLFWKFSISNLRAFWPPCVTFITFLVAIHYSRLCKGKRTLVIFKFSLAWISIDWFINKQILFVITCLDTFMTHFKSWNIYNLLSWTNFCDLIFWHFCNLICWNFCDLICWNFCDIILWN